MRLLISCKFHTMQHPAEKGGYKHKHKYLFAGIYIISEVKRMEGEKAYRYGWVCGRVMLILAMAFVVCELCAGCGRFDISDSGEKLVYDVKAFR